MQDLILKLCRESLEVHAAAGLCFKIKISTFGNGKALYITHPNGFTSVYCHLQNAAGIIKEFIDKAHYSQKSFEIELF
jgi:hypothetical protein